MTLTAAINPMVPLNLLFSSTKCYLPSITSISKLQYIQQINKTLLIILLTMILPMETPELIRINGCRFVNILLVNIDWTVHWKPHDGCASERACNEYVTSSIDKISWLIDSVISNSQCATFILVGALILTSDRVMTFMGWVIRHGILGEWVEVLLI